jgi:ubiquinone/menaquinone biosynthesis C-methylase UbiE
MNIDEALVFLENKINGDEKDYFHSHSGRFKRIVEETLSLLKEREECKILDVSTGAGHVPILLKLTSKHEIHATEHDESSKDRLEKEGITFKKCELSEMQLPYGDNYFDMVLFSEALEHLFFVPHKVIFEMRRVLKPGGYVILTTPNILALYRRVEFLFGHTPLDPVSIKRDNGKLQYHVRIYTMNELLQLLRETNFNIYKSFYYQPISENVEKNFVESLVWPVYSFLIKLKPSFSHYLWIFGTKPI